MAMNFMIGDMCIVDGVEHEIVDVQICTDVNAASVFCRDQDGDEHEFTPDEIECIH